ncbi:MAG: hypothetical protein C0600_09705 [Ignavibacteria bacterium]|nr:MAG: hypothetical protein C0600_09705 [Ignavibacteria bacterium]
MPYCPHCHVEYQSGASECIDCLIPLVAGTPQFCPNCKEFVQENDTFCDNCGVILPREEESDSPECENHPDADAIGGCVICGKPVCEGCSTRHNGRIFCENDDHLNMHQGFVVAYTTSTDYEAEMIKANLEGAGINAVIFNQHDHVYFLNMGVLAHVNVMVPRSQMEEARDVITALLNEEGLEEEAEGGEADT